MAETIMSKNILGGFYSSVASDRHGVLASTVLCSSGNQSKMELQISDKFVRYSNPSFSPSLLAFNFRPSPLKNPVFFHFKGRKWCWTSKIPTCSSFSPSYASNTKRYGGWEDLKPIEDSIRSGKLGQFQSFLISVGIDDRKHLLMFLLGLVSALAISRVKVSSILVFPASVLVFAAGFALGVVRVGDINSSLEDVSGKGSKRTPKEENSDISANKLKKLVDFFSELDAKLANLTKEMNAAIDSNRIQLGDLESYVEVIKSISLSALPAKSVVEASINTMGFSGSSNSSSVLAEDREVERHSSQKPSRRRKELYATAFDIFHFLGGFFQEYSVGMKHNKVKDIVKTKHSEPLYSKDLAREVEEKKVIKPVLSNKSEDMNDKSSPSLDQDGSDMVRKLELSPGKGKANFVETDRMLKRVFNSEELSYPNGNLKFMNNHNILLKMGDQNEHGSWLPHDNPHDQEDVGVNSRYRKIGLDSCGLETDASLPHEQTLNKSNGAYLPNLSGDRNENGTCRSHFREERMKSDDKPSLLSADSMDGASSSSSSMISDDVAFDRYLTEAADLLKKSRERLRVKGDTERAEVLLYKSARLLSQAIAMKPMSLLAVGQLGNTYLLHGELKLKISRDLRTLLSRKDSTFVEKQGKVHRVLDDQVFRKDRIASMLVEVCEECEELLTEAGRKYRLALSIDGNDVRALYNWGLALSFRAQLIADIGPEAAFDADKLYLAAIDKFDAMMSKTNAYAPDALFRWGMALQHRSRMRPSNNKEKKQLLQQARRLFEDALHMGSDNIQVREALASCMSELNLRNL